MQLELEVNAIQFLSRQCNQAEQPLGWTSTTQQGRCVQGILKYEIGTPLSMGVVGTTPARPLFVPPWPQLPAIGPFQYVDPYAERRWPCYISLRGRIAVAGDNCTLEIAQDLLQRLRMMVSSEVLDSAIRRSYQDQTIAFAGYRWGYWTGRLDCCGNPSPHPKGKYAFANPGEPVGPGYCTVRWFDARRCPELTELGLAWSQAFSMPNRKTSADDAKRIQNRVQQLRMHWNSYGELRDAKAELPRNNPKGAVRSAASGVEAALRFYAAEWGLPFLSDQQDRSLPFGEKIERFLRRALRPSYSPADPATWAKLGRLYYARNKMHEGDCYYKDEQTHAIVRINRHIADELVSAATEFCLWLDSQA